VLAALAAYQNEDGGFGHGLEPDIRTPASSVIATTQAFAILRRLGAGPGEPLVQRGIVYFLAHYDAEGRRWPIVPPAVEDAPHAPWWTYADGETNFNHFWFNPIAEALGYLYDYPDLSPAGLRAEVFDALVMRMAAQADPLEMHDLLCLIALSESDGLSDKQRSQVEARVRRAIPATVVQEPAQWAQYGLTPLQVAPTPDARFADRLDPQAIAAQLDWWLETQLEEGVWPLPWSWAQVDPEAWAEAEREWQSRLLVERLATLAAYGRIAPSPSPYQSATLLSPG